MSERVERVPLPPRIGGFVGTDDITVSVRPDAARFARRYHFDIAEDALAQTASYALASMAAKLGERVAYEHRQDIERVIMGYIMDRTWAEPIIKAAIDRSVRAFIYEMLTPEEQTSGVAERPTD